MLAAADLALLRDDVRHLVGPGLDEVGEPAWAPELERLALDLIGPFADPAAPDEMVQLLPEALEGRGDTLAAGLLAALAALGPQPLARMAGDRAAALATRGVESPLAGGIGAIGGCECQRAALPEDGVDLFAVSLDRPNGDVQPAFLFVEFADCGGMVVGGVLGPPTRRKRAQRLARAVAGGEALRPLSADELAGTLRAALEHMVEHELELPEDALPALLLAQRALGGDGWPRVPIGPGEDHVDAPADEDDLGLHAEADALVAIFERALASEGRAEECGGTAPFTARVMLDWKIGSGDGRLEHWTDADLRELMLEWMPRVGPSDEETLAAFPAVAMAFLRFLAALGRLSGADPDSLAATIERLRPQFERAVHDRRNWGVSKTLVAQMCAEGVDPQEPGALDAWMEEFNSRSRAERDAVLGPALDGMGAAAPAPARPRREGERRKARRRQAKTTRRRNRR